MTETKWTPGPWRVNPRAEFVVDAVRFDSVGSICSTGGYSHNKADGDTVLNENIANAHLIAAAPDLYEALDTLVNSVRYQRGIDAQIYWGSQIEAALTTLAKARGEAE